MIFPKDQNMLEGSKRIYIFFYRRLTENGYSIFEGLLPQSCREIMFIS